MNKKKKRKNARVTREKESAKREEDINKEAEKEKLEPADGNVAKFMKKPEGTIPPVDSEKDSKVETEEAKENANCFKVHETILVPANKKPSDSIETSPKKLDESNSKRNDDEKSTKESLNPSFWKIEGGKVNAEKLG